MVWGFDLVQELLQTDTLMWNYSENSARKRTRKWECCSAKQKENSWSVSSLINGEENEKRIWKKERWNREEAKTEEGREIVDVLYARPSLIGHPLHHPPLWKNKTVSWHGGGGELEGGKLENQMWSIKTYWHAEGLPLPHSHTESTNSYSRPRDTCAHVSNKPPHTHVHEFMGEKILRDRQPCVHNQSCKITLPKKKRWCLKNKCLKVVPT